MSTISKERLEQLASGNAWVCVQDDEAAELARIALASLEAEPVGEVSEQRDGLVMDGTVDLGGASTHRIIKGASKMKRLPLGTKFYTAPPAPVSVPDAMEMDDDFDSAFEHGKAVGWNACRAAILQGADGNSPAHSGFRPAQNCISPAQCGNSPVIPDGFCIMPKKLTAENGGKGALSGEFHVTNRIVCQSCGGEGCEDCNDEGGWDAEIPVSWDTIKRIHEAAVEACSLPAAPQQEVK
ncbi:hypothetical protein [Enterobacter cloacae]|uniref:hypothetical protein n=1 Tax=Enterobacter cloacae TaxID=550 RepID=UPI00210B7CDA|nr:hypothetical protein [Enterobacter cloacae]MCQ4388018.1 hypothetical protein [Enterobacter cloacae]